MLNDGIFKLQNLWKIIPDGIFSTYHDPNDEESFCFAILNRNHDLLLRGDIYSKDKRSIGFIADLLNSINTNNDYLVLYYPLVRISDNQHFEMISDKDKNFLEEAIYFQKFKNPKDMNEKFTIKPQRFYYDGKIYEVSPDGKDDWALTL